MESPQKRARGPSRRRIDPGFSIIETMVALALLAGLMVGIETTVRFTAQNSSYATQRTTALNLIAGDISQVEGLSFASLQAGLNASAETLTNDPNIVTGGSTGYKFNPTGASIP